MDVLVVCGDMPPLVDSSISGAGLRGWGIGQGLKSRGMDVAYAIDQKVLDFYGYTGTEIIGFEPDDFDRRLRYEWCPGVVIFQGWSVMAHLRAPYRYTVLDMHGALLLETLYRVGTTMYEVSKMAALRRADHFICSGNHQRHYFWAWLLAAGRDIRQNLIDVVPFSVSPELPEKHESEKVSFVYGGLTLPWQNPDHGLQLLAEKIQPFRWVELNIFTGKHPMVPMADRRLEFENYDRVYRHDLKPRDFLLNFYQNHASIAWDYFDWNPEREITCSSRTAEYLWAGLPVVIPAYSEYAKLVEDWDAGWVVESEDMLAGEIEWIMHVDDHVARSHNAQELVRSKFTWDTTIHPLYTYIKERL